MVEISQRDARALLKWATAVLGVLWLDVGRRDRPPTDADTGKPIPGVKNDKQELRAVILRIRNKDKAKKKPSKRSAALLKKAKQKASKVQHDVIHRFTAQSSCYPIRTRC